MAEGKTCSKCNEWKILLEFSKHKRNKDGLRGDCKCCNQAYYSINKKRMAERMKIYRQSNKEKIVESKKQYRELNKDKLIEKRRIYYQLNKEKFIEKRKAYCRDNQEKIAETMNKYRQLNKGKIVENTKKYNQSAKGKSALYKSRMKRRSYKHKVRFSPHERINILDRDNWECQKCGIKVHDKSTGDWNTPTKAHVDHIVPISKGGNSEPKNLRVLCRTCNLSKRNKEDEQLQLTI